MSPKLLKIPFTVSTAIVVCLLLFTLPDTVSAQQFYRKTPKFTVVHLPRKLNYDKAKLNEELSTATSKEAVRKILRVKNFRAALIIIQIQQDSLARTWTINTGSKTEADHDNIILQSRGSSTTRFYKISDFKNFFRDTLVLFDTLTIELYIHDEDYPDDQYYLAYTCGTKTLSRQKIPFDNFKLVFSKALLMGCADKPIEAGIYNYKTPDRMLASGKIAFLTEEQKEALLDIAGFYKKQNPSYTTKELANQVTSYCSKNFGTPFFPQLIEWLQGNLTRL